MMDFFVHFFRVKSVDFIVRPRYLQYLEYAMKKGLKFKKVHVTLDGENMEGNRKVLSACALASEVHIISRRCPDSFRFKGFHGDFDWFTGKDLCALNNCSSVRIDYVKFRDADFNEFLKHWITGTGKMKTLVARLDGIYWMRASINPQTVLNGIPSKKIESNSGFKFEIERFDGVKAYVTCDGLRFTLGDSEFSF